MVQAILRNVRSHDCEISLLLTDNLQIQDLNREYRGEDHPTDVLSFSMCEGEFKGLNPHILGDVVISVERADEMKEERGVTFQVMTAILIIHGILHLHGYDHKKGLNDARVMEKEEARLLILLKEKNLLDG
ncbi:MAG: rRNA maturation RNase YbeY [Thermodesulfobacteriota bacterium]